MSRETVLERIRSAVPAIAPSMLKCDFGNLYREMELLETAGAPLIHLDVMDGHFVPNLSYGPMVIERMRELTSLPFDAHLMISEPDRYLDEYLAAGCDAVTFHYEAVPDAEPVLRRIRDHDVVAGLAINPGTSVDSIVPFLEYCDLVLVMSVEPGFGGQEFMPSAVDKLRQLKSIVADNVLLSVDGGIGASTIGMTARAGADVFVAGSAIFDQPDYETAVRELEQLASQQTVPEH